MRTILYVLSILLLTSPLFGIDDFVPAGGYGNYGGGYHHASTVAEGRLRGMGDLVRSAGAANLMNSQAYINRTIGDRNRIYNHMYGADTYFKTRALNRQYRAEERGPRATMQQLVRLAKVGVPPRLSPSEFDSISGEIHWPVILRGKEYQAACAKVEALYLDRAAKGFLEGEQLVEAHGLMNDLKQELKANQKRYPSKSYLDARKFIDSLRFESEMPAR